MNLIKKHPESTSKMNTLFGLMNSQPLNERKGSKGRTTGKKVAERACSQDKPKRIGNPGHKTILKSADQGKATPLVRNARRNKRGQLAKLTNDHNAQLALNCIFPMKKISSKVSRHQGSSTKGKSVKQGYEKQMRQQVEKGSYHDLGGKVHVVARKKSSMVKGKR